MRPTSPQLTNPSPVDKFRDSNTRTQGEDYGVEPTATSNSYIQQPRRSGTYNSGCNSSAHEMMLPTRRALYRPHGSPDHRGSGSYSPTQQGIPTHRYGGPGNSYPVHRSSVHPIQSGIEVRPGTQVAYWRTQSTDSNRITVKICMREELNEGI